MKQSLNPETLSLQEKGDEGKGGGGGGGGGRRGGHENLREVEERRLMWLILFGKVEGQRKVEY